MQMPLPATHQIDINLQENNLNILSACLPAFTLYICVFVCVCEGLGQSKCQTNSINQNCANAPLRARNEVLSKFAFS